MALKPGGLPNHELRIRGFLSIRTKQQALKLGALPDQELSSLEALHASGKEAKLALMPERLTSIT